MDAKLATARFKVRATFRLLENVNGQTTATALATALANSVKDAIKQKKALTGAIVALMDDLVSTDRYEPLRPTYDSALMYQKRLGLPSDPSPEPESSLSQASGSSTGRSNAS